MVLLGAVSIVGLLLIQFLWIRQAYVTESQTFDHNVHLALKNVVESLCQYEGEEFPAYNTIEQLSGNYYIVRTAQVLHPGTLEYFLSAELSKRNILTDFEYGIYDCQSQLMVYGNQGSSIAENNGTARKVSFPSLKGESYYFGVLFPSRQRHLLSRIDFLMYVSAGLLLVVGFFAYTTVLMARQKRLSEVQRDFINNMTHEFKTPLSTIKLSAEVIKSTEDSGLTSRLQTYATLIEKEAERLQHHVEEVLQVAQIEKSKLKLNMKVYPLDVLLENFCERAGERTRESGGTFSIENETTGIQLNVDALHLQNVFNNLLDNSLKYTVAPPEILLKVAQVKQEVVLQFIDNGIGISQKDLRNIFKKFYRVSTGDVQNVAGFGLGLFYVKQIVSAHKGTISASSNPGKGSTFSVSLPVYQS